MKRLHILIHLLAAFQAHQAFAQQSASGVQSPATGSMVNSSISYGDYRPVQNNVNNTYKYYHVTRPVSSKLNSLDRKREALLMAENPTVLEVAGIAWPTWFGDGKPFMTIVLQNKSKLPALDVHLELLDMKTGHTIASLKPYTLKKKSYTMRIIADQPVSVPGGGGWSWPLVSAEELAGMIKQDCITGGGLDYDSMTTDWESAPPGVITSDDHTGMYLRVSYTTIFDEKVSFAQSIVIDSTPPNYPMYRERGTHKVVPLRCL